MVHNATTQSQAFIVNATFVSSMVESLQNDLTAYTAKLARVNQYILTYADNVSAIQNLIFERQHLVRDIAYINNQLEKYDVRGILTKSEAVAKYHMLCAEAIKAESTAIQYDECDIESQEMAEFAYNLWAIAGWLKLCFNIG